jgi:hypothetical protein
VPPNYCKIFLCSVCISIGSPSTIFPHLNLLHSLSSLSQVPPPTHTYTTPILWSCLLLLISKLMFKGFSQRIPTLSILYFGLFSLSISLPYPFTSYSPVFQKLSVYILVSSTFTDVMFYNIIDALSFFFLSLLPQVP